MRKKRSQNQSLQPVFYHNKAYVRLDKGLNNNMSHRQYFVGLLKNVFLTTVYSKQNKCKIIVPSVTLGMYSVALKIRE